MSEAVSTALFAGLVPLDALKPDSQLALVKKSTVVERGVNELLFRTGESASQALYLLGGEV